MKKPLRLCLLAAIAAMPHPASAIQEAAVRGIVSDPRGLAAPGCAVGVFRAGKPVLVTAAGAADIAGGRAIDADTLFYAASVSKQFTALAVAQLVEAGKIGLDDDIRVYFPEMPPSKVPVTVAMLMHHSAGIRDSLELLRLAGFPRASATDKDSALRLLLAQRDTNFTPGTQYSYSNGGYLLLAEIVERVSGMAFADYAQRHILKPLGMKRSFFMNDAPPAAANVAHGYVPQKDGFAIRDTYPTFSGSGGLMTSINDLARYDRDIEVGRKIWTPAVAKMLLTPASFTNGDPVVDVRTGMTYAGGLHVGQRKGQYFVQHGGSAEAFKNMYARLPERRLGVVVLCNRGDWNAGDKADAVIEAVEGPILTKAGRAGPPRTGRFFSVDLGAHYDLAMQGQKLVATISSALAGPAAATGEYEKQGDGSYSAGGTRIVFDDDGNGFTLGTGRITAIRFVRVDEGAAK
ncbi:MAG: serine hydrolase domain-containing protein [Sphingopyxis sp.]|uniref:serine hydrolase domain-containing protein n=1 Tax=Sphingopyxis sp. TaxID=1908224 RepID=UPI0032F07C11